MADFVGLICDCITIEEKIRKFALDAYRAKETHAAKFLEGQLISVRVRLIYRIVYRGQENHLFGRRGDQIFDALADAATSLKAKYEDTLHFLQETFPKSIFQRFTWALTAQTEATQKFEAVRACLDEIHRALEALNLAPRLSRLSSSFNIDEQAEVTLFQASIRCGRTKVEWDRHRAELALPENNVFFEKYSQPQTVSDVAENLSWSLDDLEGGSLALFQSAMLPCLGYRDDRVFYLLPENIQECKTLRQMLYEDMCNEPPTVAAVEVRFQLALQAAEAIFEIHSSGLAHCAVRSDSLMIVSPSKPSPALVPSQPQAQLSRRSSRKDLTQPSKGGSTGPIHRQGRGDASPSSRIKGQGSRKNRGDDSERPKRGLSPRLKESWSNLWDRGRSGDVPDVEEAKGERRRSASGNRTSARRRRSSSVKRASSEKGLSRLSRRDSLTTIPGPQAEKPRDNARTHNLFESIPEGYLKLYIIGGKHFVRRLRRSDYGTTYFNDVYCHPETQARCRLRGSTRKPRNMGHDLYSLGVCLLEIGLWSPMVYGPFRRGEGVEYRCSPYLLDALRARAERTQQHEGTVASLLEIEGGSEAVKGELRDLSRGLLPQRMGTQYANIVEACLTCLDAPNPDHAAWGVNFRESDRASDCATMEEKVLKSLRAISMAFDVPES